MLNLDPTTLNAVVEQACRDAAQHGRWLVAIGRAAYELEVNPWIERGDHGLLIGSASGNVYAANGVCQCRAFEFGQACWHRAAARLVRLHDAARESASEDRLIAQVETIVPSLADRLARARAATAAVNELFA